MAATPSSECTKTNEIKSKIKLPNRRYRYIPPHLRGRQSKKSRQSSTNSLSQSTKTTATLINDFSKLSIKQIPNDHQMSNIKERTRDKRHETVTKRILKPMVQFKWYKDEQLFESKLGVSFESFKLNDPSYIDQNRLNALTRINTASSNPLSPTLIFIIGPPAIGKSSIYHSYLSKFDVKDERNFVNTDGDLVRKCHYGINKYLELSNKLNIGFDGIFRYYVQKWSGKWKINTRKQIMGNKQNLIAFSTCHKSQEFIHEINTFINNGYNIKILMVCAEYDKCSKMGESRERFNGRKYLHGAYSKSMQGCIDCIDHLLKNKIIYDKRDLIVVRNTYEMNQGETMNDDWKNIKNRILIPMKKRAIKEIYKYYHKHENM